MPVFCLQKPLPHAPFSSPKFSHLAGFILLAASKLELQHLFFSMADTILRLVNDKKSKAYHALGLLCLMLFMEKSGAREFQVAGPNGNWAVPADNSTLSYNKWAENNRFQIGDSLVFNYPSDKDSVLYVTKDAYTNCSTEAPLAKYSDGHTVFTFNHSGPHYFISGNKDNCLKNEKLIVVVLADRSNRSSNTTDQTSPPPSGSTDNIPPAPAPAGEYSPPAGTVEINPTPAPEAAPSAASSTLISLINSIGAFAAASSLLLAA